MVTDKKAFRERVSQDLDGHFDRDAEWVFRRRFVTDLIDHIKMDLPDTFLKRWIMLTNENPLTPEQVEEKITQATRSRCVGKSCSKRWLKPLI